MIAGNLRIKKGIYQCIISYIRSYRKAEFDYPLSRSDSSDAKIRNENISCRAKCGNESWPPENERLPAGISGRQEDPAPVSDSQGHKAGAFRKSSRRREHNKKVCGNCYNYEYYGYVFVDELGDLKKPYYLTEYFPQYIQKHGLRQMRFHDLRHSCASLLLANGVSMKQIQE